MEERPFAWRNAQEQAQPATADDPMGLCHAPPRSAAGQCGGAQSSLNGMLCAWLARPCFNPAPGASSPCPFCAWPATQSRRSDASVSATAALPERPQAALDAVHEQMAGAPGILVAAITRRRGTCPGSLMQRSKSVQSPGQGAPGDPPCRGPETQTQGTPVSWASHFGARRQKFLRHVYRHGSVGYGRDHLPQRLGAYISYGIHAGDAGLGGFPCGDIAAPVQL